ncbi:MAG: hypothetical protein AAF730_09730 [Bacteroidota bacterium]
MSRWILMLVLASLSVVGCSSTELDPFDNQERFFTVWGFLDVEQSVQRIRVIPIRRTPEDIANSGGEQALIDAQVRTIDMRTGAVTQWRPRLVQVDGPEQVVQLFEAGFTPREGDTYRLEVTRSDGVQASAEVTVPDYRTDNEPRFGPWEGEGNDLAQTVTIADGPPQAQPVVEYWIEYGPLRRTSIPYEGEYNEATGEWRFTLRPGQDVPEILQQIGFDPSGGEGVALDRYFIKLRIPDADWVLPDAIPLGAEGQPGVYDNIENGYGYFGMIGWYRYAINPAGELADRIPLPR